MNGKIAWTDDDFSDGRERSTRAGRSRFGIARLPIAGVVIAGLVAAAVVGGIVTWLVSGADDRTAANSPPLIKADDKPIKVYPDSPGGLDVPNRDKLVYSRLKEGGERAGEIERLSPAPEEPLAPPTMLEKPAEPPAPASARSPTGNPFPTETVGPIETPPIGQPAPAPTSEPEPSVAAVKPVPVPPASKPAAQAEKPPAGKAVAEQPGTTKKPATGKLYVQLLASRSQSDALGAWKQLQSKNGDLLGGLASSIARADLGERGVFYRLRAGPIASEARAKSLCSALADRKVSCLIVRSGA